MTTFAANHGERHRPLLVQQQREKFLGRPAVRRLLDSVAEVWNSTPVEIHGRAVEAATGQVATFSEVEFDAVEPVLAEGLH